MSLICPNISHPDWQYSVEKLGKETTLYLYDILGQNIPTKEQVDNYLSFTEDRNNLEGIINQKQDFSDYYTISVGSKFDGKNELLSKFRLKRSRYHYYYVLTQDEQKRLESYLKNNRWAREKLGRNKNGFEISDTINGKVTYKIINNRPYLLIDVKEFYEEDGVKLPKKIGSFKVPIELVYFGDEEDYKKFQKEKIPYIPFYEKEINKYLFKTKGISLAKSMNFYSIRFKNLLVETLRIAFGKTFSYEELSSLTKEDIDVLVNNEEFKNRLKIIQNEYKKEIDLLDVDAIKQEILDNTPSYNTKEIDELSKLLNYLPDNLIKLLSFRSVANDYAAFDPSPSKNKQIRTESFSLKEFDNNINGFISLRHALAINITLRKLYDNGVISDDDIKLYNSVLKPGVKRFIEAGGYSTNSARKFYDKLSILKANMSADQFTEFEKSYNNTVYEVHEYVKDNLFLLTELSDTIINSTITTRINDVFGSIILGDFSNRPVDPQGFVADNLTIAGHELGHAIDRYLYTTSPKLSLQIRDFVTYLVDQKEFSDYIEKGLQSRRYPKTNKKEMIADLYAYISLKAIGKDLSKGHLRTMDEFFNNPENELLIVSAFNINVSFEEYSKYFKYEVKKSFDILNVFKEFINSIINFVNSALGKEVFLPISIDEGRITTTYHTDLLYVREIYTILNNFVTDESLYEVENILNADTDLQKEWSQWGAITEETKEQFIARMNSRIENGMYKQKDGTLVPLTSSYNPETWWIENTEGLVSFKEKGFEGKRKEILFKHADARKKVGELYDKYNADGYVFKTEQVVFPVTGKSKTKNFAPNNRKIYRIRVSKALGRDFDSDLVQDYTQTIDELRTAQNASREQVVDLFNRIKGKDPVQVIDEILAGEIADEVRSILTVIRGSLETNPTLAIMVNDEATDKFADYDPNTNTITINSTPHLNRDATEVGISLAHELIHAYTLRAFRNRYTENEKEFATTIERLFNIAKKNTKFKNHPAFTSAEEWLGYVLTEPKIMNEAMKMKLSLWKRFVLAVKKLLGISTVYDEAFNTLIGYLNTADITVYKPNKLQLKLDRQIEVELAESKKNQDTYLEKVLTMLNKYDKMFDFNAADHTYTLVRDLDGNDLKESDQIKFISVTQGMESIGLSRKFRLSEDKEKAARQKAYGERVAGIGNIFHGLVEADINEIAFNLTDGKYVGLKVHDYALQDIKNFLKRFKDRKITILSEVLVADLNMRIAGTIDLVVIDEDGQVHIYDFKTRLEGFDGDKWSSKKDQYEIQVSIYKDLLEGIIGVDVASINIVTIKPQVEGNELVSFALDKSQSTNGVVPVEYNNNCKLLYRTLTSSTPTTSLADQYISDDSKKARDEDYKNKLKELHESIQDVVDPRERMVLKSIQQLEVKRRLLQRSPAGQYELQSLDKTIDDLVAEKEVEKQLITLIKYAYSTANRIDVEITTYRKEGKVVPIELLKKWKDSILAFDAILNEKDGLETLLTKEHGLSGGPEYRDTLNKVIRLGNAIKSLYQDAAYDQLVEFLSPYYHRLYAELRLIKTKEYRRKKFLGEIPNNISERDYVEKAIDENEDDLQSRTKNLLLKEIKKASRDVGVLTRWIDNLLDTKDPVTAAMIKAFVYTDEKARIEALDKRNELVGILRKVEDFYRKTGRIPKSNEDFYSFMLEKDEDGQFTGYLLRPYTSSMMAEYRKIREDARQSPLLDTHEKRSAYISSWLNGDEYLPGNMPLDKEKFLNAYYEFIEEQVKTGNISETERDNIRDNQLFKNKATVKEMVDSGALSFQTGEILGTWLHENTWSFRTPHEKWRNKDFDNLQSIIDNPNDPRGELYNYIVHMSREADMHLPFGFRLDGRLPGVIKQNHERIASGHGIFETSKMAMTRQLTFTIDDVNRTHEELIDLAGNPKYFLPIHFTRRITKKTVKLAASGEEYTEEKYDPSEQSFDLPNIYYKYWQMANDYFHKSDILPQMELAKFIIDNRPTTKRDSFGNAILKHLGGKKRYHDLPEEQRDLYEREITGSYLSQQVNDWFMSCVYGEYEKDAGKWGKLDVGKLLNFINSYTSLNLLGVNFVAGTANIILGETLQRIESFAGEYMSPTDFMYADKFYLEHFGGIISDVGARDTRSLGGLLIDGFGILDDYGKTTFDQRTRFGQMAKMDTLYFTSHLGEHYMQSRFLFGLLANKKVKDLEGNEIGRLLDQYVVKDGKLILKQESEMKPAEYQKFLKINKWTDADQQAFKMKTRGILSRLHGEYSTLGRVAIQRSALGRMAYLFRHFVVPGFRRRWGTSMWTYETDSDGIKHKVLNPAAYSERLEQFIEGNYITTGRFLGSVTKALFSKNKDTRTADDFFGRMIGDLQSYKLSLIGAEWAALTDHEKANIYRTLYEVTFLITAIILASVASNLKADAGDDDDELEAKWWAFIAYQAYRLQNELLFFTPKLDSAMSILRSPAASMSFVENLIKLSGQIFHPLDRYESGNWKGRLKIVKTLNNMAPGIRQIYRLKDIDEQLPWMQRSAFGYSTEKERQEREERRNK